MTLVCILLYHHLFYVFDFCMQMQFQHLLRIMHAIGSITVTFACTSKQSLELIVMFNSTLIMVKAHQHFSTCSSRRMAPQCRDVQPTLFHGVSAGLNEYTVNCDRCEYGNWMSKILSLSGSRTICGSWSVLD